MAKPSARGWVAFDDSLDAIVIRDARALRGYSLKVSIGNRSQHTGQSLFDALGGLFSDDAMTNSWPVDGGSAFVVAVALRDPVKMVEGTGILARLNSAGTEELASGLQILDAQVLLSDWSVSHPQIKRSTALPTSTVLLQNYPNPFNPSTVIPLELAAEDESSKIMLEVFNLLGQRIRTLIDGRMRPGAHEIAWDGTDREGRAAASGIYIYRLSVGRGDDSESAAQQVISRRLLLLH